MSGAKNKTTNIFESFLEVLKFEKGDISAIYFYAIFGAAIQLMLPLGIQSIISFVLGGAVSTSLVLLIAAVIISVLISGHVQVNQMKLIERIEQRIFVRYAFAYAISIPRLNLKEVDSYFLPEFVNRFFDTVSLQKGISKLLLDIPAASIQILFGLLLLSFYHPVFIFFGIMLLLILYLILRATGNKGLQASIVESDYKYKVAGYLEEMARVVTTLKTWSKNALHLKRTDEYVEGYLEARTDHFKILVFQYRTLITLKVLITAAMLIIGSLLLVNQQLNVGQFIAAEIVILMVIGSIEKLILNLDKVYDVLTSVEKVNKVVNKPRDIYGNGTLGNEVGEGISIQASNVSFSYDSKPVLKNLTFSIAPNEKVCINGAYSSGKSTLLKLLSGLYIAEEGSLKVNGKAVHELSFDSFHDHVGLLLDNQTVFMGTLMENITGGNGEVAMKRLEKIASIVGLNDFITEHREGYSMWLNPTGRHLSSRVIKKILLMRALAHEPALLLLEEPWLELEDEYVHSVQEYILELKNTTVLVVTEDKQFAAKCGRVITLENGTIKNNGYAGN